MSLKKYQKTNKKAIIMDLGDLTCQLMRQIQVKTCKLCSKEMCRESNMLPGYVCQDPVLNLIPASH